MEPPPVHVLRYRLARYTERLSSFRDGQLQRLQPQASEHLCCRIRSGLVLVFIVHHLCIALIETKCHSPVCLYRHRPRSFRSLAVLPQRSSHDQQSPIWGNIDVSIVVARPDQLICIPITYGRSKILSMKRFNDRTVIALFSISPDHSGPPFNGPLHPHSGVATLTYVAEGAVSCIDPDNGEAHIVAIRDQLYRDGRF